MLEPMDAKAVIGLMVVAGSLLFLLLRRRPPAPTTTYIDLDTLKRDVISSGSDPESTEGLFQGLKRNFGDRAPAEQLQQFFSAQTQEAKTRRRALVAKAASEGKAMSVEDLQRTMERVKAEYKGENRDELNRETDNWIASLRAQYGGQIPLTDALDLLEETETDLERSRKLDRYREEVVECFRAITTDPDGVSIPDIFGLVRRVDDLMDTGSALGVMPTDVVCTDIPIIKTLQDMHAGLVGAMQRRADPKMRRDLDKYIQLRALARVMPVKTPLTDT